MDEITSEHAKALSQLGAAKGGKTRAESLTADERKEIARRAAEARWGTEELPKATHDGKLDIAGKEISCAVLEDGTRLLTQRDFLLAIGRSAKPAGKMSTAKSLQAEEPPPFLVAENLRQFVPDEVWAMSIPINFRTTRGGRARGYNAKLLPKICDIYLNARDANQLAEQQNEKRIITEDQKRVAEACYLLMRGLAQVGIIALVDEATGYQKDRENDELQRILAAYVNEEFRPWIKGGEFKPSFFEQIYRLHGWEYKRGTVHRPQFIGNLINKWIYEQLPKEVLPELRKRNPVQDNGYRRKRHHQLLTENIGLEHLRKQLDHVTMLMRASETKEEFEKLFARVFPSSVHQQNPVIVDADEPPVVQGTFDFDGKS